MGNVNLFTTDALKSFRGEKLHSIEKMALL